jgi:hypothetical protein
MENRKGGTGGVQAKVVVKILKLLVHKSVKKKLGYKISYFFMQARLKSGKALNRRNELNVT